ncbi:MAG: hypothetical protein UW43_C0008G0026 [Candidatus Yanofskybacteria bacterium GW2011_GWA1_44_21]|uniref:Uncharacterized protein n=3 Tax=Parcubacteria group TaxID=1794811 RepID=A0A0G0XJV2_9BACT|nr:MAG: hypothetical protein UU85_C0006G0022 [Candidatus Wolfebacteria bacterium GW2011_GWA2_42_10]KKT50336.1 MAG: hypothetical protein UW43_C0008G0026 [Candidatus Yanofskybacteria bacterium GW2011_GWA1_44_21]KKT90175.1 MAG: hypothetical protein UW90_C0005G0030 [Candidatus Yanofskybacteria bacterium GW2011_GWB1_45_11]OGN02168.1 MAG: hypothetical protein A2657_01585 [Candidatus Yanofskybacteria bacterium RIFCSPHIGHO2_01_FULL_44_110b]OGN18926.1 MAG: hypothetical protein A3F50_01160 [Candidatus Ya
MRKDKVKAFELRRQEKSYSEISELLGIPKSTLATWFKKEEWSQQIRDRLGSTESLAYPEKLALMVKATKERWARLHQQYRDQADKEFFKLKKDPLFIAGLMLYWGEGDKVLKNCQVRLSNSDPRMIRMFYVFLKKTLVVPEEKIRANLLLYPDLIDEMQKKFWSKSIGITLDKFNKSVYIKGRHPTRRLSYGVCNIFVMSRELKEKIIRWTELIQVELLKNMV